MLRITKNNTARFPRDTTALARKTQIMIEDGAPFGNQIRMFEKMLQMAQSFIIHSPQQHDDQSSVMLSLSHNIIERT